MITMNTASILLPPARVKTHLIYCPACEFRVRESSWVRGEHSGKRLQGLIKSLFRASYGRSCNDALVYMLAAFIVSVGDDMPRIRGWPGPCEPGELCRGPPSGQGMNG
jgi:hypothetical protein